MFDWNDQELESIIWGEATETDDHIVPYPKGSEERPLLVLGDENKKRWKQETTKQGQKTTENKTDFHGCQQESISNFETNGLPPSRNCMASSPDLSLSNIAKTDQNSMGTGTGVSDNLNEVTKSNLSRDDTVRLEKEAESFQNRYEDKDQGDFDDYGWANIGSFDDLDRIFSNDDPLFGHVSLGNADELWSASKEVGNSSIKTFPLFEDSPNLGLGKSNDASNQFQTKTECGQQDEQSFTLGCGKLNDMTAHGLQDVNAVLDEVGYAGAKSEPILKDQVELNMLRNPTKSNALIATDNAATLNKLADKVSKRKQVMKCRKKFNEKNKGKLLQDFYGTWSPPGSQFQQFEKQIVPVPSMLQACPSTVLSQQGQLQGRYFLQYLHISSPHVIPSAYGNFRNQYSTKPSLPHMHPGEDNHQRMLSCHDVSQGNADHLNKSLGSTLKPLTMTPQEKIEKLRRRQKIRAMLAIKKQQQQFTHLVSCADPSNKETQFQCIEGADVEVGESLSILSSLDPNSPLQQDDSSIISMAIDNCSLEDTILYQLQDIIANLDIKVRLCMRDSLFRLAQSALQRHNASDITSTNKTSRDEHDVIAKEETNSHNRYARMPDVETETNPIDRMVAHLLFHKPNSSENIQTIPCQGSNSKPPCSVVEPQHGDQYINSPCIDASENASNNESTDGGAMEVETSQ